MSERESRTPERWIGWLLAGLVWLVGGQAEAQVDPRLYDYARPSISWKTIETDHFLIHYHADEEGVGSGRTARVVARIAEDVYGPITSLYQHEPDEKVSFILKDYEDYSNGAAYFFDNKIEIWAPSLETPLRGSHNWLRNVITHEFTHIVQVQKTIKSSRRLPIFYVQWIDYEDVRRPDVLYGYPDAIASYPIPGLSNPAWLAEGTAQYQRAGLAYDTWDTHRDMLFRTLVLEDRAFDLEDMGTFLNKSGLEREQIYNHGFAFTLYLAATYGEDVLRRISEELSRWSNYNVERAIRDATGTPASEVYQNWIAASRAHYDTATRDVQAHRVDGETVNGRGTANYTPVFSPDGTRIAYVSNQGEDFNLLGLYVHDLESDLALRLPIDDVGAVGGMPHCTLGDRIATRVSGGLSWHPDGSKIAFARVADTPLGYLTSDLWEIDLDSGERVRLTDQARASSPAYAPDGNRLVFVRQNDGSTNLVLLDPTTGETTAITHFDDGHQVTAPAWHPSGEWIYFGLQIRHGRDLYRVRPDGTGLEPVLATPQDERDPAFSGDGRTLFFTSDRSGIFNLYRVPVEGSGDGSHTVPEQLTNVVGGVFMPAVGPDGSVAFARYDAGGYRIARLDAPRPLAFSNPRETLYEPPNWADKSGGAVEDGVDWADLNAFDDTDLAGADMRLLDRSDAPAEEEGVESERPVEQEAGRAYDQVYTSFGFYPVLRFDMYAKPQRGAVDAQIARRYQGGRLWRNTKVGAYMSSREVLEGLTMFGGFMVGPGSSETESLGDFLTPSKLLKLERDLFLQFEYRKGLGKLPKRWSPQISVEMYNLRRNVQNGLSIEEFPCTACYPDTTYADIAYTLWEGDVYVRSKVNRSTLLELGYRYSPYRVRTESFFSREFGQTIDASGTRYFIGHALSAKAYLALEEQRRNAEFIATGIRAEVGYEYQPGRLLDDFDVEDGLLLPQYRNYKNHRLSLDARIGYRFAGSLNGGAHGLGLRLKASTILGDPVDTFFDDYVGGLIGARGYPFYALGGNEVGWLQASYTFPLVPDINRQVLFLYATNLYARVFTDAALAWSGAIPGFDAVKKDIGAELRLGLGSFYLFPTAVFLSTTYGFDTVDVPLNEGFILSDGSTTVRYGKQWLWHFGLLFNFDV